MEEGYDKVNKRCKLCNSSFQTPSLYDRHHKQCHDPTNSEKCDVKGCTYRFKTQRALRSHQTSYHNQPATEATLPENQRMVWAQEVKCVHNQSVVGLFVGVTNFYHAETAAKNRDREGVNCIVSKHFMSEELCYCDHSTARKLFTVTVPRKDNETEGQFQKRVNEGTVGYKMYTRQHFVNSIYSHYGSSYELSEKEKKSVRAELHKSDFSQYYSEDLQQSITYNNWKNSAQGQEAVAAKKMKPDQPGQKRKAETVTSCEIMSPVKQKRVSDSSKPKIMTEEQAKAASQEKRRLAREAAEREGQRLEAEDADRMARDARAAEEERLRIAIEEQQDNPPNLVLKMIIQFGRPAIREWVDKLSQEEKQSKSKVAVDA